MRRAATWAAYGAAGLGWAALFFFFLFGPIYSTSRCNSSGRCVSGSASGLASNGDGVLGIVVFLLALWGLFDLGAAVVARSNRAAGLGLMIACLVLLLGITLVSFGLGPLLLPADLLGIMACVLTAVGRARVGGTNR